MSTNMDERFNKEMNKTVQEMRRDRTLPGVKYGREKCTFYRSKRKTEIHCVQVCKFKKEEGKRHWHDRYCCDEYTSCPVWQKHMPAEMKTNNKIYKDTDNVLPPRRQAGFTAFIDKIIMKWEHDKQNKHCNAQKSEV